MALQPGLNTSNITINKGYEKTRHYEPTWWEKDYQRAELILILLLVLHGAGAFLVIANVIFLKCTRGERCRFRRPCKVKSDVACNTLIIYHVVLLSVDIVLALVNTLNERRIQSFHLFVLTWFLVAMSYFTIGVCCFPIRRICFTKSAADQGLLLARICFEMFNFVVFWFCIIGITICQLNCKSLPMMLRDLNSTTFPITLIPAIISYIALLVEAVCHHDSFENYEKVITKQEAVQKIKQSFDKLPSIEWTMKCEHRDALEETLIAVICRDTKVHTFRNSYVRTSSNITQEASVALFKGNLTTLNICICVLPGDEHIKAQVTESKRLFKQLHEHEERTDILRRIRTLNRAKTCYLVADKTTLANFVNPFCFWIFSGCGLSLPYRTVMSCLIGQVNCRIKKCVYKPQSESTQLTTDTPLSPTPPDSPGHITLPDTELFPSAEPSPPPRYPGPPRSITPPPDYESACENLENKSHVWV